MRMVTPDLRDFTKLGYFQYFQNNVYWMSALGDNALRHPGLV
jgi:hypothetical protein